MIYVTSSIATTTRRVCATAAFVAFVFVASKSVAMANISSHAGSTTEASVVIHSVSPSVVRILNEGFHEAVSRVRMQLTEHEILRTEAAVRDAISTLLRMPIGHLPLLNVTEDGIASAQWEVGTKGVMLFFAGDGNLTVATSSDLRGYAESLREYRIDSLAVAYVVCEIASLK